MCVRWWRKFHRLRTNFQTQAHKRQFHLSHCQSILIWKWNFFFSHTKVQKLLSKIKSNQNQMKIPHNYLNLASTHTQLTMEIRWNQSERNKKNCFYWKFLPFSQFFFDAIVRLFPLEAISQFSYWRKLNRKNQQTTKREIPSHS